MNVVDKIRDALGDDIASLYKKVIDDDISSSYPLLTDEEKEEIKSKAAELDASLTFDYKSFKVMLVTIPNQVTIREVGNARSLQLVFKTKTMSALFNNPRAVYEEEIIPRDPYLLVCTGYVLKEYGGRMFYNASDSRALISIVKPTTEEDVLEFIKTSPRTLKDIKERFGDDASSIVSSLTTSNKIVLDNDFFRLVKTRV